VGAVRRTVAPASVGRGRRGACAVSSVFGSLDETCNWNAKAGIPPPVSGSHYPMYSFGVLPSDLSRGETSDLVWSAHPSRTQYGRDDRLTSPAATRDARCVPGTPREPGADARSPPRPQARPAATVLFWDCRSPPAPNRRTSLRFDGTPDVAPDLMSGDNSLISSGFRHGDGAMAPGPHLALGVRGGRSDRLPAPPRVRGGTARRVGTRVRGQTKLAYA